MWEDHRSGSGIYAARITGYGGPFPGWPVPGVPLRTAAAAGPVMTTDGAGGIIVTWLDRQTQQGYDIYAQRILPSGRVAEDWPPDGVPLGRMTCGFPVIVSDGAGGAIVAWNDNRQTDHNHDIYAQHLSSAGSLSPGWPAFGFGVNVSPRDDVLPAAVPDGRGGALVAWESFVGSDLFAQRVAGSGAIVPGWSDDGLRVSAASGNQRDLVLAADEEGGAIAAWYDARSDNGDIYGGRFTSDGTIPPGWPADGLAICRAPQVQLYPAIASVPGGAMVVWTDFRNGTDYDVYAARIIGSGGIAAGWPVDGLPVCAAPQHQMSACVVGDGAGGVIVAWTDQRNDGGDIFAQRITAAGAAADGWPVNGVGICTAAGVQASPRIESDDAGGAIICWTDNRNGPDSQVYAARVTAGGITGPAIPAAPLPKALGILGTAPNPTRDQATVLVAFPTAGPATAKVFDLRGALVYTVAAEQYHEAGTLTLKWSGRNQDGSRARPGVYLFRVTTGTGSVATRIVMLR